MNVWKALADWPNKEPDVPDACLPSSEHLRLEIRLTAVVIVEEQARSRIAVPPKELTRTSSERIGSAHGAIQMVESDGLDGPVEADEILAHQYHFEISAILRDKVAKGQFGRESAQEFCA
jgi:hypothetical protein